MSNLREKEATIQKLQIQVQVKEDQLKQVNKRLDSGESDGRKAKLNLEDANRTIRDLSAQFIKDSKLDKQAIARKNKELETVLREKKCTNCILCVEDIKLKNGQAESIQLAQQITKLNEINVGKSNKINELEESLRQAN